MCERDDRERRRSCATFAALIRTCGPAPATTPRRPLWRAWKSQAPPPVAVDQSCGCRMIEAERFSHVTFEISDLERQIAYFTDVAGLVVAEREIGLRMALAEGVGFEPEALAQRARSFRSSLCRTTNARSGINRGFDIPSHFPPMRHPAQGREVAEGVGFEPTIRFPVYTLSKRAPSATRPPLRARDASAI
jgi:hypothetical protein